MQKHYNYLNIDLDKKIHTKLKAKQGDSKSRYILVNLISNSTYYDLSDCAVKIYGIKKDKTIFFNHATVINGKQGQFEVELTAQALSVPGEIEIQILILGTNQEKLTTFSFFIDVEKTIIDDAAIESTNEFTALTEALSSIQNIDNKFAKVDEQFNTIDNQKANKEDVARISSGTPLFASSIAEMADTTKNYVNTTDGYLYSYSDGSWKNTDIKYQEMGLSNGQVTVDKTSFLKFDGNLFDLNSCEYGKTINDQGVESISTGSILSYFIDVEGGQTYEANNQFGIVQYDELGNYLTGRAQTTEDVILRPLTRKVKISLPAKDCYNFIFRKKGDLGLKNVYIADKPIQNIDDSITVANISKNNKKIKHILDMNRKHEDIIDLEGIFSIKSQIGVMKDDFVNISEGKDKSYNIENIGTTTTEIRLTSVSPFSLIGIQEFILEVFIEDVSKISNVQLNIGSWSRSGKELKNGWNFIRYISSEGDLTNWSETSLIRIVVYSILGGNVSIGSIRAVRNKKAKIMFVCDHGYKGFKEIAFPRLAEKGIPTTWAISPGRLGEVIPSATSILTEEEVLELADSPYSEFSFHTWNVREQITENMTSEELKTETAKCIRYLRKHGLMSKYFWRCCFVGNIAPNHEAIQEMVEAYASPTQANSFTLFPFKDCYNIPRITAHGRTNEQMDKYFDTLKKTRCMAIFYTHDISDNGEIHMTNAEFDYFMLKVTEGVNEGWLEGVTYNQLMTRYERDFGQRGIYNFYRY